MFEFKKLQDERAETERKEAERRAEKISRAKPVAEQLLVKCQEFVSDNGSKCIIDQTDDRVFMRVSEKNYIMIVVQDQTRYSLYIYRPGFAFNKPLPPIYLVDLNENTLTGRILEWYENLPQPE